MIAALPSRWTNETVSEVCASASDKVPGEEIKDKCIVCFQVGIRCQEDCPTHHLCDECFTPYTHVEIANKRGFRIKCPDLACAHDYSSRLSPAMKKVLATNKSKQQMISKTCNICRRQNALQLDGFDKCFQNKLNLACTFCRARFCLICSEPVESPNGLKECAPYMISHKCADPDKAALLNYIRDLDHSVKPCPNCLKLVTRSEGCPSMICNGPLGCGQFFCFNCLDTDPCHPCEALINTIPQETPPAGRPHRQRSTRRAIRRIARFGCRSLARFVVLPAYIVGLCAYVGRKTLTSSVGKMRQQIHGVRELRTKRRLRGEAVA